MTNDSTVMVTAEVGPAQMKAGQVIDEFDVSWSAISQLLTVLKAAGFVVV